MPGSVFCNICSCLALVVWTIIATIEDPNAKPENATEASNISHVLIDDTKVNYYDNSSLATGYFAHIPYDIIHA